MSLRISLLFNRNLGPDRSIDDRLTVSCGTIIAVGFAVISTGSILIIRRSFTAPFISFAFSVDVDTSWIDSSFSCEYEGVIINGGTVTEELIKDIELAVIAFDELEEWTALDLIPPKPILNANWSILLRDGTIKLAFDDDPSEDNDPVSPDNI